MSAEAYLAEAGDALQKLNLDNIRQGARRLADTIAGGNSIFAFGASHAFMVV